ncbi:Sec sixty-one [Candida viswanathii]|uniref:Sec sixty-one n=1 Tax=Candida viswanathii TaxID=5486 RepID=A0A367XQV7_9ASCO|nr:Sec sixty-one [Candida viswanathii]
MSGFRLLDLVKFFLPILPEIEAPYEKISFDEKIVYTVGSAILFLFGQLPVYGLKLDSQFLINDPFYNFRSIFAMNKGTLFELGLLPMITAGFIWQILAGLRLINVNFKLRYDRELFQTGQKLTSFVLSAVFAAGLIYSGYYDNAIKGYDIVKDSTVPYGSYLIIFLQITTWSWIVTLIVEIFDKGYSFGSGVLSFLAIQVGSDFVGKVLGLESFKIINSNRYESYGALMNLLRNFSIFKPSQTINQIWHAFTRVQLPNLTHFYIALLSILLVIYLQNMRIELPIRSSKVRGMNNVYPIRLLYTGGLPVLFAFTVVANIQVLGYLIVSIASKFGVSDSITSWLAHYVLDPGSNNLVLTSGALSYFSSTPTPFTAMLSPVKTTTYALSVVALSVWFSLKWSYISGGSPKDISKQFKDQGISLSGKRDISIAKELGRVVPVAAVSGAFCLSAVVVAGEVLGGLGNGVAAIVGITSTFAILEEFMLEYQQSGGMSGQFANAMSGF